MVNKTYLPSYLCDSSDGSDNNDGSDSCDRNDISDSSDSSDSSDCSNSSDSRNFTKPHFRKKNFFCLPQKTFIKKKISQKKNIYRFKKKIKF